MTHRAKWLEHFMYVEKCKNITDDTYYDLISCCSGKNSLKYS